MSTINVYVKCPEAIRGLLENGVDEKANIVLIPDGHLSMQEHNKLYVEMTDDISLGMTLELLQEYEVYDLEGGERIESFDTGFSTYDCDLECTQENCCEDVTLELYQIVYTSKTGHVLYLYLFHEFLEDSIYEEDDYGDLLECDDYDDVSDYEDIDDCEDMADFIDEDDDDYELDEDDDYEL